MRMILTAAAAGLLLAGPARAATTQLADTGFETVAASVAAFCYGHQGTCPAGAWTTDDGGGYQDENNSAWPGQPTPDGAKYAFIQSAGWVEQAFTANDTGVFTLSWLEAGRPNGAFRGDQTYDVLLNGDVLGSFASFSFQPFTAEGTGPFNLFAGQSYTLRFQGTNLNGGDNTAFLDQVELNYVGPITTGGVPEPATWALMILGFGAAGATLRKRRTAIA